MKQFIPVITKTPGARRNFDTKYKIEAVQCAKLIGTKSAAQKYKVDPRVLRRWKIIHESDDVEVVNGKSHGDIQTAKFLKALGKIQQELTIAVDIARKARHV